MRQIAAILLFFLVTLAVFTRSVSHYPGESLAHRLSAELHCLSHVR